MSNESYSLVWVPSDFEKPFGDFNELEAKNYLNWFLEIRSDRIAVLENAITKRYPNWKANFTIDSLENLFEWLISSVAFRIKTPQEQLVEDLQLGKSPLLKKHINPSILTLSDETASICFDVGLYFGQVLKENIKGLDWTYKLAPRDYIHYAQPVLSKRRSKTDLNPRHIIEITALKILESNVKGNELKRLYEVWSKLL